MVWVWEGGGLAPLTTLLESILRECPFLLRFSHDCRDAHTHTHKQEEILSSFRARRFLKRTPVKGAS